MIGKTSETRIYRQMILIATTVLFTLSSPLFFNHFALSFSKLFSLYLPIHSYSDSVKIGSFSAVFFYIGNEKRDLVAFGVFVLAVEFSYVKPLIRAPSLLSF